MMSLSTLFVEVNYAFVSLIQTVADGCIYSNRICKAKKSVLSSFCAVA